METSNLLVNPRERSRPRRSGRLDPLDVDRRHQTECSRYASVPAELRAIHAWLPFRIEHCKSRGGEPRTRKIPHNIAGRKADYTNPRQWMTFQTAYTMLNRGDYDGLGIVLDPRFGIVGYDADSCISDGSISPPATEHIKTLNTYTEESFSGNGIHCFAYGTLPPEGRKHYGFEMYSDKRFFVVTGLHLRGTSNRIEHRQSEINVVHAAIFGEKQVRRSVTQLPANTQGYEKSEGGGVLASGSESELRSDEQVLRLLGSDSVAWPYFSVGAGQKDPSGADFALGGKLAFYTGGCLEQMYRLFMLSALATRPKCSTKRGNVDYLEYTLRRCLKRQPTFWQPFTRVRKSTRPVGRPLSQTTKRILRARKRHPSVRPHQIARTLNLNPATVRKVLSRHLSERVGSHEGKQRIEAIEVSPQAAQTHG